MRKAGMQVIFLKCDNLDWHFTIQSGTSERHAYSANLGFLEGRKGVVLKNSGISDIWDLCSGKEHQFQVQRRMDESWKFLEFEDLDFYCYQ